MTPKVIVKNRKRYVKIGKKRIKVDSSLTERELIQWMCCDDSGAVPDAHVSYLAQRRERRGEWVVGVRMVCCCWSVED